jgi:Zn-dependent protease with chaperone function
VSDSSTSRAPLALSALVNRRERVYYALMLVISILVYGGLIAAALRTPDVAGGIVGYGLLIVLVVFMTHGMMIGHLRGNGVRVTATQFPALHRTVMAHSRTLGMTRAPDVFVLQAGGLLNAFATRFLGRDFVVLYSDVLAVAEQEGESVVGFIVAHELAHVKRGHLKHRWLITPGRFIPYLGAAYSRACEYTCDRFAAHCQPDGAVDGLLMLAAGTQLYRRVDARQYARQVESEAGFWVRRAELMSSHPTLPKRVAALIAVGANVPSYSPMLDRTTAATA